MDIDCMAPALLWMYLQELDQMRRNQKQQATTQSATEVRLNRALEDIEKLKDQLGRAKTSSRVIIF